MRQLKCDVRWCREPVISEYAGQYFCQFHTERLIKKLEEINPGHTFVLTREVRA